MNVPGRMRIFPLAIAKNENELPYLPLGLIIAHLRSWADGKLAGSYDFNNLLLGMVGQETSPFHEVIDTVSSSPAPVCLFSSYVWNHALNLQVAREIKERNPRALVIFGGPEVPKYQDETEAFLESHDFIDVAVLGEGELTCAQILDAYQSNGYGISDNFKSVPGAVYRNGDSIYRCAARERISDVNELPSPYLTEEFGDWLYDFPQAVLETNRGCPYGCTYCDWGSATLQQVTRFSPERVIAEINYIAARRSHAIFIADANFGMLEQDIEIARALVDSRAATGYPKRVYTNFAKNGGRRLMEVIKILHEGGLLPTGIIALQTTDPSTLKAIKRENIKTSNYEKMMEYFNSEKIPMASDIMIGLPGQTVDSLQADLQFCFDWKVAANGNYTSMMPNAPMAEKSYREEFRIEVDKDGLIASTSSFSSDELQFMKALHMTYLFHVTLGVMKYYLYYVQIEYKLPAIGILRHWLDRVIEQDPRMPLSTCLYQEILAPHNRAGDWSALKWGDEAEFLFQDLETYFDEFHAMLARDFNIHFQESVLLTLRATQSAVNPRLHRNYPFVAEVPHNIVGYFKQIKSATSLRHLGDSFKLLHKYAPGKLSVAPFLIRKSLAFDKFLSGHGADWEYRSPLRFH